MSEWFALSGRITFFPAPSSKPLPSVLPLFRSVWGGEPLNFQTPTNPLAPSVAQGRSAGLGTTCSVSPSRIDLTIAEAFEGTSELPTTVPVITDGTVLHDEIKRIAGSLSENWLPNPILRIALGLNFISPTETVIEANRSVLAAIPEAYRIKLENEEEFILQFNRPRLSTRVKNLKLNLLTKWSVEQFQIVTFAVGVNPASVGSFAASPTLIQNAASILFDINNVAVPLEQALPVDQQSSLVLEALDLALQCMHEGKLNVKGFTSGKLVH